MAMMVQHAAGQTPQPRGTVPADDAAAVPAGIPTLPVLRRLPFLAGAPDDVLAPFAAKARWQVHAPGEVVVDAGDTTDTVFFVLEGAVRVVIRTESGYEMIFGDLGAGEFFGEMAAIDGVQRSANVTALSRTRLCSVPGPVFMALVLASPPVCQRLLRLLTARLRVKDERMLESVALPVRQRLMAELLRLSRDRGGGERTLSPPPPQHVLAARIGLRRETVSRELARMARAGLVTVGRRAIVLHRPDELRAEVAARLRDAAAG